MFKAGQCRRGQKRHGGGDKSETKHGKTPLGWTE
jgi:hypothetical protein